MDNSRPIPHSRKGLANTLASGILAGEWAAADIGEAIENVLSTQSPLCQILADRIMRSHDLAYPPSPASLAKLLRATDEFHTLCETFETRPRPPKAVLASPHFSPSPRFAGLDVPQITTAAGLAHWLKIELRHLHWFADSMHTASTTRIPVFQHYRYTFIAKPHGPARVIEAPKPKLKRIQKQILRGILDHVPAHDAAHGFVAGRSCLTSAQIHAREDVVLTCDLRDFFLRTSLRRVHGLYRSLGYPWNVARLLTGLCSTSMPASTFERLANAEHPGRRHDWRTRQLYASPHLPAGAPTSPALANLAVYPLDARLAGLARRFDVNYSRYADDLSFSGSADFAGRAGNFLKLIDEIVSDEGYAINPGKTRIMPRSTRQQVTGVVVNQHNNLNRDAYDRLKATLYNCVRNGPASENRENHPHFRAHLEGHVTWAENINPQRARKLRVLLDQIVWT